MRPFIIIGLTLIFLIAGCCCALTPDSYSSYSDSSSCPYGTYGSACSYVCSVAGTGSDCVSDCLDNVEYGALGDATTCCAYTFRQECDSLCDSFTISTGSAEAGTDCMDDCLYEYEHVGIDVDTCYVPV
jgi:hypothetical protein